MSRELKILAGVVFFLRYTDPAAAGCLDRVTVRPSEEITAVDPVSLEILLRTFSAKARLVQPTEVLVDDDEIFVDVYVNGGPLGISDSLLEIVEFGPLPAGDYQYHVTQHPTKDCELETESGTFCVQAVGCNDADCGCPIPAAPYRIRELNAEDAYQSKATAINSSGQVVVVTGASGSGFTPFLWDNNADPAVTVLRGFLREAWDVNDVAQVVGESRDGAFFWDDGVLTTLGTPPGVDGFTIAYAVNNSMQVVGVTTVSYSERHAFLWQDGIMLDVPSALGGTSSTAWDINSSGQFVGRASTGTRHVAYLWNDGKMVELESLGGTFAEAFGINDAGQIVGKSARIPGEPIFHAFLWENGEITDLGALGEFFSSSALAVNNKGQVVGSPRFFFDPETGLHDHRDLLPVNSGWEGWLFPVDINDKSQIVGRGYLQGSPRGFLMTPAGTCCYQAVLNPLCVDGVSRDDVMPYRSRTSLARELLVAT